MKHTPRRRAAAAPQTTSFLAFLRPPAVTSADASASERCRADLARMARAIAKKEAAAGGGGERGVAVVHVQRDPTKLLSCLIISTPVRVVTM